MLVVIMENQVIAPQTVCQTCLLADHSGQPRWRQGHLCCGQALPKAVNQQPEQYQCQMGFRIANIE